MIENYINKHTVMGMMSKHYIPFDNFSGFYKNKKKNKVVVYSEDKEFDCDEINYYYIKTKPNIKYSSLFSSNVLVSNFNDNFFSLKGKEYKEIRESRNKWEKSIEIKNYIDNIEEILDLLKKWDEFSGGKYGWQRHSGHDKSFFIKYYEQEKKDLFSLFFYCNNILIGYSIVSKIQNDNCFRYNIRKCDVSIGRNIGLYIDFKTFENIYSENKKFYINWGASAGNLQKYKKKFPVYKEVKVWFYKIKNKVL
jgi:hypothetical protein